MIMAVIHISEAEAARDFTALLARVRAGAEVRHPREAGGLMSWAASKAVGPQI